jgi:hypothetical protein
MFDKTPMDDTENYLQNADIAVTIQKNKRRAGTAMRFTGGHSASQLSKLQ